LQVDHQRILFINDGDWFEYFVGTDKCDRSVDK